VSGIQAAIEGMDDAGIAKLIADYDDGRVEDAILWVVKLTPSPEYTIPLLQNRLHCFRVLLQIEQMRRDGLIVVRNWPASFDGDVEIAITEKGRQRKAELDAKNL